MPHSRACALSSLVNCFKHCSPRFLHSVCGLIISHAQGIFGRLLQGDARLQISQIRMHAAEFLEWRLRPVLRVGFPPFALFVHHLQWEVAGTVVAQVRIEALAMKHVHQLGMPLRDMAVAQKLKDDHAVLSLYQRIVV